MKATIKFLFRLMALPFMLCCVLLSYLFLTLKGCYMFLFYGGEILIYNKKDRVMMGDVYTFAKKKFEEKQTIDSLPTDIYYQPLFDYFSNVHNKTLLQSEMDEIIIQAKNI